MVKILKKITVIETNLVMFGACSLKHNEILINPKLKEYGLYDSTLNHEIMHIYNDTPWKHFIIDFNDKKKMLKDPNFYKYVDDVNKSEYSRAGSFFYSFLNFISHGYFFPMTLYYRLKFRR